MIKTKASPIWKDKWLHFALCISSCKVNWISKSAKKVEKLIKNTLFPQYAIVALLWERYSANTLFYTGYILNYSGKCLVEDAPEGSTRVLDHLVSPGPGQLFSWPPLPLKQECLKQVLKMK